QSAQPEERVNGAPRAEAAAKSATEITAAEPVKNEPAPEAAVAPQAPAASNTPAEPAAPAKKVEKEPSMEDFASVLESFEQEQAQTEAALNDEQIVSGHVLKVTPQYVVVDI